MDRSRLDPNQAGRFRVLAGFDYRAPPSEPPPEPVDRRLRSGSPRLLLRKLLYDGPESTLSFKETARAWGVKKEALESAGSRWNGVFRPNKLRVGDRMSLPKNVTCDLWEFNDLLESAKATPVLLTARTMLLEAESVFRASEDAEQCNPSPKMRADPGTSDGRVPRRRDPLDDLVLETDDLRSVARFQWALLSLIDGVAQEVLDQLREWTTGDKGSDEGIEDLKRLWQARVYAATKVGSGSRELRACPFSFVDQQSLTWWANSYIEIVEGEVRDFKCYRPRVGRKFQVPRSGIVRGRQKELARLHDLLKSSGFAIVLGLGGQGKTSLALAHEEGHGEEYGLVAWITAARPALIEDQYLRLVRWWKKTPEYHPEDPCGEAKAILESNHGLVIFDDAADPRDIRDYLPVEEATVLITTRDRDWKHNRAKLAVELGGLADDVAETWIQSEIKWIEPSAASELNARLDGHPLALSQAIAYIRSMRGWTLQRYLRELGSRSRDPALWDERPPDYPATIVAIWKMAQDKLKGHENAVQLLRHLALVDPDGIAIELLDGLIPGANASKDLGMLTRYCMVGDSQSVVVVHRVVQDVTRSSVADGDVARYVEAWAGHLWEQACERAVDRSLGWFAEDPETSPGSRSWRRTSWLSPNTRLARA